MAFDPIKTNPVHGSLKRLAELCKSSQLTDLNDEIDEQRHWYLDRIRFLVRRAQVVLRVKNKYSINANSVNNINSSSESIINELNSYINSKNIIYIDNAYSQADQGFAIYLSQIESGPTVEKNGDFDDLLQSFRESSRSAIGELKSNLKIANKALAELGAEVESKTTEIQKSKEETLSIKKELDEALAKLEQSQSDLIISLDKKFDQQKKLWGAQVDDQRETRLSP